MSQYLKKLKTLSQYNKIESLLIYIIPSILLMLLSNLYPILLILLVVYLFLIYKNNKTLFIYSTIISIILLIIYFIRYYSYINYKLGESITGVVTKISDNSFNIKSGIYYIKIYSNNLKNINIGDKLNVTINEISINERNVEGAFSYYRYKLSKGIVKEGNLININESINSLNIYKLKGLIINYIDTKFSDNSRLYLKRLVLGINDFDSSIDESINNLGVIFLFCISGLHVSLLSNIIKKILNAFNIEIEIQSVILIIILIIYSSITEDSASIKRASLIISINELTSFKKYKMPKLDSLTLSFILLLLINPFYIFESGFYLTFLTVIIIYISKSKKALESQFIIILFTTPMLLYTSKEVSIFMIILSLIFNLLFENLIIPLSYITILFYPLGFIYEYIVKYLSKILEFLNTFNLIFNYSINSIYLLIVIYIFLLYLFKYKENKKKVFKSILIIIFSIIVEFFIFRISIVPTITMIDCAQGDLFLIRDNKYNILVDTGPNDKYNTIISYLRKNNINYIDALFISHTDSDHYSNINNINDNILINKIIMPIDNENYTYGNIRIHTIKYDFSDSNNSSMILYTKIKNRTILFTGDIEKEAELKLISDYKLDIDILKVSHHGSNSSSCIEFLNYINPKISLISVGLNNSYNHPNDEVLDRLNSIESYIYRTDLDGTTTIYLFNNFYISKKYKLSNVLIFDNLKNLSLII